MSGSCSGTPERADPALIAAWVAARSVARGLPAPIAIPGGWHVETGSGVERRRYVFNDPCIELANLARSINVTGVYLKLCRNSDILATLLPSGWQVDAQSWVMTGPDRKPPIVLPLGYRHEIQRSGSVHHVRILAEDGALAASGYAAETDDVFVYDRIVTADQHQRRGLGTAIMAALGVDRSSSTSRPILVATAAGRALYERLGWVVHAPYASAVRTSS